MKLTVNTTCLCPYFQKRTTQWYELQKSWSRSNGGLHRYRCSMMLRRKNQTVGTVF